MPCTSGWPVLFSSVQQTCDSRCLLGQSSTLLLRVYGLCRPDLVVRNENGVDGKPVAIPGSILVAVVG